MERTIALADAGWLDEGFLTTTEAADLFHGVIADEIGRWCRAGYVRSVKERSSGRLLVSETDIRAVACYCEGFRATMTRVRVWWERHVREQAGK